jgi:hypothetical protein
MRWCGEAADKRWVGVEELAHRKTVGGARAWRKTVRALTRGGRRPGCVLALTHDGLRVRVTLVEN